MIAKVIASGKFVPMYVYGLSGNGKTEMIKQICAKNSKKMVRIQISPETDEDSLIGGWRLKDGDTIFEKGPVIRAMEEGALLLLDECDRGTNKILALQGILEGGSFLIKRTGELITPASGFNVVATANTNGRGSTDGKFTAASILDDAFLERFALAFEQQFPDETVEEGILCNVYRAEVDTIVIDEEDMEFISRLISLAEIVRKTYYDDGIDDVISTRRLIHIVRAYLILDDQTAAIKHCIQKFDPDSIEAVLNLYSKICPPSQ